MVEYSVFSEHDIIGILDRYHINNMISVEILEGGSENTNYVVLTNIGKLVLTICEQKSIKEATNLALLLEYLAASGFNTSEIIRDSSDNPLTVYKSKPILVKKYLEGKILENIPDRLLQYIGTELGKLHQLKAPAYLPRTLSYGMENFAEIKVYDPNSPFETWLEEIKAYVEENTSPDLPRTLIHGDVFCSNIVVNTDENKAFIMDFEEAACYYRIFDLGMAIVGLCQEGQGITLKKMHSLLYGYQKEIELLKVEWASLQAFTVYAAAAMAFWRHKNFNYVHPDPELRDHYLKLKTIADTIQNLPPEVFY